MATQAQAPQSQPVSLMAGNAAIPDGALFNLPGVTVWSEQKENNSPVSTTLSGTSQSTVNFPANFKQTDVVFAWRMLVSIAQSAAPTGTGLALSPYFPYNFLGAVALNMQNQFDTISTLNGMDLALFQAIRPQKQAWSANWNDQGLVATNAYSDQGNLITASNYTTSSTAIAFDVDLLPGINFDLYYDLEENGQLLNTKAQGIRTFVGPQMMAGTNRIIQPRVNFNVLGGLASGSGNDGTLYPYTVTSGSATFGTVTGTLNFRRKITYQPQSSKDAPLLWNWQYSRQVVRNSIGAQSSLTIPLPLVGQILSMWVRLVDPAAGSNPGPIPLANISECDVQIGSGLYRYQDTPEDMQSRLFRQHGIRLPAGVVAWDMACLDDGRISNKDAINTLTTSGPQIVINFSTTPSSSAYYVLGYEALRYVALQ